VRTVESHRRALLQKTGAKTLVGLVVQAVREGWVAVA
jgi:DNA-binding NarL/FixJ family response regulator